MLNVAHLFCYSAIINSEMSGDCDIWYGRALALFDTACVITLLFCYYRDQLSLAD